MKTRVEYSTGAGRLTKGTKDYMLVWIGDTRLYAELPVYEKDDECSNYDALKYEILRQADDLGIERDSLQFLFDV
ncbi:MAG: hypothetical protein DDT29_00721 [Dehalococcoidia bacterium]|nr:hypothetical protein [Bacillota bacterium]